MLPLRKYHLLLFNYMTMRQRTINNLIEISPQAEGSFLTQAFPTNFHQFYTKKLLTPQESVSDYKEVTAADKANIIYADSQWVEPSEELKATAKINGAVYNDKTGFFELNTLTDITAEQMRKIILFGKTTFTHPGECGVSNSLTSSDTLNTYIRTNWILLDADAVTYCADLRYSFCYQQVEVVIGPKRNNKWNVTPSSMVGFCANCPQLRIIDMYIYMTNLPTNEYLFNNCPKLETVYLCAIKTSFNIIGAPLLSLASIQYMVDDAANTSPITITLHPDAHARLTEELIAQAAEKQITFATTS